MERIAHYFPHLTEQQIQQFSALSELYNDWNSKINVISRKDMENFYERHVLHSLAIAKFVNIKAGSRILDVGTGGGFPGIPLAIIFPEVEFYLVDSVGKKIKVVNEVAAALNLNNVKASHCRAEEVVGKFDFVVSRAVTQLPEFVGWVQNKISKKNNNAIPNGILYLKGGDIKEEIAEIRMKASIQPLSAYFSEEFFESKCLVHLY